MSEAERVSSPIQFSPATPIYTSQVVGIATCQSCGALVLTSSGEAIDLHAAWHAAQEARDA